MGWAGLEGGGGGWLFEGATRMTRWISGIQRNNNNDGKGGKGGGAVKAVQGYE